jgi:hypothetical protein
MLMNSLVLQNQYRLTQDRFQDLIEEEQGLGEEYVLTEAVWERVSGEILGRVDNYIDGLLLDLVQNVLDGDYEED